MKSLQRFFLWSIGVFLIAAIYVGCGGHRAWIERDAWYRNLPSNLPQAWDSQWQELPSDRIVPIPRANQHIAIELLESVSWSALNPDDIDRLVSQYSKPMGFKPYLVRALSLNEGTGSYKVKIFQRNVFIHHGSLGRSAVSMKRQAIVLYLSEDPKEVYVTCSMHE